MKNASSTEKKVFSDHKLLKRALIPYKKNCCYLKKAHVEFHNPELTDQNKNLLLARGEFSILESCYITSTGHFNAVEFNICYNQLTYYLLAECVANKLLNDLATWDLEEYSRRQLSNILIVEFSSSFHKLMSSAQFNGYVEIIKISNKKRNLFIQTRCGFNDNGGGASTGNVLFAITD